MRPSRVGNALLMWSSYSGPVCERRHAYCAASGKRTGRKEKELPRPMIAMAGINASNAIADRVSKT